MNRIVTIPNVIKLIIRLKKGGFTFSKSFFAFIHYFPFWFFPSDLSLTILIHTHPHNVSFSTEHFVIAKE